MLLLILVMEIGFRIPSDRSTGSLVLPVLIIKNDTRLCQDYQDSKRSATVGWLLDWRVAGGPASCRTLRPYSVQQTKPKPQKLSQPTIMAQPQRLGGNLVLASALAFLSYIPFDLVAKGSLIVCAVLFIVDPIPPLTRLVSLISLLVVFWLSRLHRQHQQEQQEEVTLGHHEDETATSTTGGHEKKD
jgi:hypothetical protein